MNSRLLSTVVSLAGLVFSGCKKSEPEAPATPEKTQAVRPVEAPTPAPPPVPAGRSESEKKLALQLREMQTRQLELELKLEEEKLARADAEFAREQQLLEDERVAWRLKEELAVAKIAPAPGKSLPVTLDYERGTGGDYQMFYDDLAQYGTWYESADYGYVWRPTIGVTDNSWRPYTIGSWANSDQGWAWCSTEPFGWACYHYGRWAQIRGCGWVWVPGDQWAPSWVSWRKNDDYIGWCPLPPETVYNREFTYGSTVDRDCGIHPGWYVFMPVKHFDRPCRNYCEAPVTCLKICASTVNITNLVIRPGRVECQGPKLDWIRDSVRRPVPRYTLARESEPAGRSHRMPRVDKDTLRYFAPKVQTPWNSQLQPARHAALESQEVVRADGGLPEKLAKRFKTERREREKEVERLEGGAKAIVERQHRLVDLEQTRASLREQVARQQATARAATVEIPAARAEHPDGSEKPGSRPASARALPVPENPQVTASSPPGTDAIATTKTPEDLNIRPGEAARQREDQAAATELLRKQADAASRGEIDRNNNGQPDKQSALRAQIEENRREQKERESVAAQRAAIEQQRRAAETASRTDAAAARETEKQASLRAQLEEKRRQQQEAQNEQDSSRAAMEQQRRASEAAGREADKQSAVRAAREQQIRQAEAEAKAEQQARQREAMEQQRAANEQQRRQADADARAEQQRREAAEMQRRQEEAEIRQREAQEEQRRNAGEQQQRREAETQTRQQQVQEEQRRNAEEKQRRQAEEQAKNAAEQQRRQEADRNREEKDRGKR